MSRGTANWVDPADYGTWLRTEIESYLEYQLGLHRLIAEVGRERTIAHFKGPYLEFTRIPKTGITPMEFSSQLEALDTEMSVPLMKVMSKYLNRFYVHQTKGIVSLLDGKNVILPHPTGSGKTEIFMIPILNYLLQEISKREYGLGCVLLYPMKALENDQRDRLKGILYDLELEIGNRIPQVGVYDGDTPNESDFDIHRGESRRRDELKKYREVCPRCKQRTLAFSMGRKSHLLRCEESEDARGIRRGCGYPEDRDDGLPWIVTTREGMRNDHSPNILITNPESLDYRLLTPEDEGVFRTKMPRVYVVIDEAHAYSGAAALSLRIFLSRLEEKIRRVNKRMDISFQYVISSATLQDPEEFARNLIPWVKFENIGFEESESVLDSPADVPWALNSGIDSIGLSEIGLILKANGLDDPEKCFIELGMSSGMASGLLSTAVQFGLIQKEGRIYRLNSELTNAAASYELGNEEAAGRIVREWLSERFRNLEQAHELYSSVRDSSVTLDDLVTRWIDRWQWPNRDEVSHTILSLVRMGRFLGHWEERWHFFVRSPGGVALCSNEKPHYHQSSVDAPLPCTCSCGYPLFEAWTCQECGEIYFKAYICETCSAIHTSSTDVCCNHANSVLKPVIIPREGVKGLRTLPNSGIPTLTAEEPECPICSGSVRPVRRRTDLMIEVSTSLMAWRMEDEAKRKFLLFNDSRIASERIAREFNNLEIDLWCERIVMDIMLRDPDHDAFDGRAISEIGRKLRSRVYKPYHCLKGLLRGSEWDLFESKIGKAAFKATGKSAAGPSRLFKHGLLGYDLRALSPRLSILGILEVVPRLLDIIRLKSTRDRGVRKDKLLSHFTGESTSANQRFIDWSRQLINWRPEDGAENEILDLALETLVAANLVGRLSVSGKDYYIIREGSSRHSDDPYSEVPDSRLLCVPDTVSYCDTCGDIKWYRCSICERCGDDLRPVPHDELIKLDYFADVMVRTPRPVVAAVHRAGLGPLERKILEERFSAQRDSLHMLSSTPTLELGIDIGLLNYIMLAGVPPTRSSYIQRVGRAGRRRGSGAICTTFCYPTPVDAYYFRNPSSLVSMKAGRIPVQSITHHNVMPFIWTVSFDALSVGTSTALREVLSGRTRSRDFLSGETKVKPRDFVIEVAKKWDSTVEPWVKTVIQRALVPSRDKLDSDSLDDILTNLKRSLDGSEESQDELLHLRAFKSHVAEVDRIHSVISGKVAELAVKTTRTREESNELSRLDKESVHLIEYKKNEMISGPLLNYLHDVGTLCTARGIGASVNVIDATQRGGLSVDSRAADEAIFCYFPGAYVSRQGTQYRCGQVVYDPVERPSIYLCSVCENWLESGESICPHHANADVVERVLLKPVVAFAAIHGVNDIETLTNRHRKISAAAPDSTYFDLNIGSLKTCWSSPARIRIADFTYDYGVREKGVLVDKGVAIRRCRNCLDWSRDDCCTNPNPQDVTQGVLFETYGVRVEFDRSYVMKWREKYVSSSTMSKESRDVAPMAVVAQTLCNALLNSISIVLDIEPNTLDAVVDESGNIWIYEPVAGGSGLLAEALGRPTFGAEVSSRVFDLLATKPDHDCERYCDQCLIVPRYSFDELELLNRRLVLQIIDGM